MGLHNAKRLTSEQESLTPRNNTQGLQAVYKPPCDDGMDGVLRERGCRLHGNLQR